MGDIAGFLHISPRELWEFTADDLLFWHEQAVRIAGLKSLAI
ncbi:MAG: GpE family phage tail protein [Alphaproteobacteria bacterium]|nr:GpE family phage tail protein [Alphaproteobacteria bacterium]